MIAEDKTSAHILDNASSVVQRLYDEIRLRGEGKGNHRRVFSTFADLGRALVDADTAYFWRWDKRAHRLVTYAASGCEQIMQDDSDSIVGRSIAENRPIVVEKNANEPCSTMIDEVNGATSMLVMPVTNRYGEVIGALQMINKHSGDHIFDEIQDAKRLSIASFICGMALESDLCLDDSERDRLTELKNRFGFYCDFKSKYRRLLQSQSNPIPLSVILCDIDSFQKVNDTYGHLAGDVVLNHIAHILSTEVRDHGCAYRWGGDEFTVVVDGATIGDIALMAELIRTNVESSACHFESEEIWVTLSLGCAELSPALSIEENIKVADDRLYRAKDTGRNRVVFD